MFNPSINPAIENECSNLSENTTALGRDILAHKISDIIVANVGVKYPLKDINTLTVSEVFNSDDNHTSNHNYYININIKS